MNVIKLTQGLEALVDDEDYARCLQYKWCARATKYNNYGFHRLPTKQGLHLHRFVLGLSNDDPNFVDHIDRNGLNNQKSNLRVCTQQQNNYNKTKTHTAASGTGFKGVQRSRAGTFSVRFSSQETGVIYLGTYPNLDYAAKVYDKAAVKYHKEFALLNFPELLEEYKKELLNAV